MLRCYAIEYMELLKKKRRMGASYQGKQKWQVPNEEVLKFNEIELKNGYYLCLKIIYLFPEHV